LINRERLDSVRKKYGHYASWAVWGAEGLTPKSGTGFWGGYLTDIIKDFEEKVSGMMMAYLRQDSEFERANIKIFREEIAAIGSVSPTLIALGGDSFAILKRSLGEDFRILKALHYSMYISPENYRRQFPRDEALHRSGFSA
jgi:hypothetical protein